MMLRKSGEQCVMNTCCTHVFAATTNVTKKVVSNSTFEPLEQEYAYGHLRIIVAIIHVQYGVSSSPQSYEA